MNKTNKICAVILSIVAVTTIYFCFQLNDMDYLHYRLSDIHENLIEYITSDYWMEHGNGYAYGYGYLYTELYIEDSVPVLYIEATEDVSADLTCIFEKVIGDIDIVQILPDGSESTIVGVHSKVNLNRSVTLYKGLNVFEVRGRHAYCQLDLEFVDADFTFIQYFTHDKEYFSKCANPTSCPNCEGKNKSMYSGL